jgi:hypothetical protein
MDVSQDDIPYLMTHLLTGGTLDDYERKQSVQRIVDGLTSGWNKETEPKQSSWNFTYN